MSTDLPTVVAASGLQPTSPAAILAQLIALVSATNPGYTANLPASLIEDVASTDVASIAICDSARVELVNSLTPFGANPFLLNQLGNIYGTVLGAATNTSVYVVFSGPPSYVVPKGFTVSDGTYSYVVQDGGVIGSGGSSGPLFALATVPGSWPVAPGTVTGLITSVPTGLSPPLTVVNPETGTPGAGAETAASYRARTLQAGLAASQGMPRYLKTLLGNVPGVQPRLISVRQGSGGGWEVICGGGDPYAVAYAIFEALFDVASLVGSTIGITGVTKANPGVATTDINHGLTPGQTNVNIAGATGMTGINGGPYTIAIVSENEFSFGVDTTGFPTYTGGGVVTPNARNVTVSLSDYPDTYAITFVNPPQQAVAITATWNTTAVNFVSPTAVAQLAAQPLVDYVNSIPVGAPINVLTLDSTFRAAVASALPPELVTRLIFAVTINAISTDPDSGTQIIEGDPESYFFASSTAITVIQG